MIDPEQNCQCYFCLKTFKFKEIREWTDEGETPICPKCGVDAVILEHIGMIKLKALHKEGFDFMGFEEVFPDD